MHTLRSDATRPPRHVTGVRHGAVHSVLGCPRRDKATAVVVLRAESHRAMPDRSDVGPTVTEKHTGEAPRLVEGGDVCGEVCTDGSEAPGEVAAQSVSDRESSRDRPSLNRGRLRVTGDPLRLRSPVRAAHGVGPAGPDDCAVPRPQAAVGLAQSGLVRDGDVLACRGRLAVLLNGRTEAVA